MVVCGLQPLIPAIIYIMINFLRCIRAYLQELAGANVNLIIEPTKHFQLVSICPNHIAVVECWPICCCFNNLVWHADPIYRVMFGVFFFVYSIYNNNLSAFVVVVRLLLSTIFKGAKCVERWVRDKAAEEQEEATEENKGTAIAW